LEKIKLLKEKELEKLKKREEEEYQAEEK